MTIPSKEVDFLLSFVQSHATGFEVVEIDQENELLVRFRKGEDVLDVFVRSKEDNSGAFLRTDRFLVGYRGNLYGKEIALLLEAFGHGLRLLERDLGDKVLETVLRKTEEPDDLVILQGEMGTELEIRITDKCNEKCPFCNSQGYVQNFFPDQNKVLSLLEEAYRRGIRTIVFTGGEPTLVRGFPSLVEAAKRKGFHVVVQTNGLLWSDRYFARFKYLPDQLFVSFHTRYPEKLTEMVGLRSAKLARSHFQRKCDAIRRTYKLGIDCELNFVVNTLNLDEVQDFPDFVVTELGHFAITFSVCAPTGACLENIHLLPRYEDIKHGLGKALIRASVLGLRAVVPDACGLPLCIMQDHARFFDSWRRRRPVVQVSKDRMKGDACKICEFDPFCIGVWKAYAVRFGLEELKPIKNLDDL
jgi:pyruvate-formate lyase-activating enzyme